MRFSGLGDTAFQKLHIGEDKLQVDGFDIAERIDAAVYMDNIWILKATDNVYDRVYLTDIGKGTGFQDPRPWKRPLPDQRYQRTRSQPE